MEHNVAVNRAIAVRSGSGEQKLLHTWTRTVRWSREVCIVCSRAVLSFRLHGVVARTAAAEVVYLEVARCLRKTKVVGEVVHDVVVVEEIGYNCRLLCSRIDSGVERKGEVLCGRCRVAH